MIRLSDVIRSALTSHRPGTPSLFVGVAITLAIAVACAPAAPQVGHVPAGVVAGSGYAAGDRVPPHDTFSVHSRELGETRRINVYVPAGTGAPARGPLHGPFPVLYMPDGGIDEDFPHVANTVDSLIRARAIRPLLVVGIPNTERRRDLTGATRVARDSLIAARVGGAAAFRRFLRQELRPAVAARYPVSAECALLGESLAGLFVVETLLLEATFCTHYIAFDPSLWWNAGALVDAASSLLRNGQRAPTDGASSSRTLYLASSGERELAELAARLADSLRAVNPRDLRWTYVPRPDLTHGTIFRGVKADALVDAFR